VEVELFHAERQTNTHTEYA